ncbi:unnamed protein product [Microthlaspi erraticum]|uniref:Uncharacterized protein n=1 Tax=Microthlaspi erraticum TaxID=1685480 RepID=A0A6D2JB05_9BRAS|nr:unnamed protein product [Microthlaspi erraticum]
MECGEVGVSALALELLLPSLICFFGGSMNGFFFFFILSFPFVFAIGYLGRGRTIASRIDRHGRSVPIHKSGRARPVSFLAVCSAQTVLSRDRASGRARAVDPPGLFSFSLTVRLGAQEKMENRGIFDPPGKSCRVLVTFSLNPSRFSSINSFGNRSFMLRSNLGSLTFLLGLASSSILDDPLGGLGVGALVLLLACVASCLGLGMGSSLIVSSVSPS